MAAPKKIFFSYSNEPSDLDLYQKIHKHFISYSRAGLLAIIDKEELLRVAGDSTKAAAILNETDITVPLLSIDYVTNDECLQQFKQAASNHKTIVPVFLRDFDWHADNSISPYEKQMLPDASTTVEERIREDKDDDTVFKEIAQRVKSIALPEVGQVELHTVSGRFYYIIAAMVLLAGVLGAWYIYDATGDWRISIAALLMAAIIAMISLKNVLFPDKMKIKK